MDFLNSENNHVHLNYNESLKYCTDILPNVSRSFAIGINFLTGELKKSVLIGYLLCRIIDTVEDDIYLEAKLKEQYLLKFIECFNSNANESLNYSQIAFQLQGDKFHIDLVKNTHKVFQIYYSLSKNSQNVLMKWVIEMTKGMALFVKRHPLGIRVATIKEYKEYCYYVAGTVGYLLTDLWQEYGLFITKNVYKKMNQNSVAFGEALQSVNILKDIAWDAKAENSIYIPSESLNKYGVTHELMLNPELKNSTIKAISDILFLAHEDVKISIEYLKSIPKWNFRIRFFCIFPLLLAIATLKKLEQTENILTPDKVIKVSRNEVKKIKWYSIFSSFSNLFLNRAVTKVLKF